MAQAHKVLGQANPAAATWTLLYTVPALTEAIISTLRICNRSATPTDFSITIRVAGAGLSDEQYIFTDLPIEDKDSFSLTEGLTLAATDEIWVKNTLATVSYNLFGQEIS